MKKVEDMLKSDPNANENKPSGQSDFSKLIEELKKIKDEGNSLYKQKKYDDAKKKYQEGLEKYGKDSFLVNKEKGNNQQCKDVIDLYKKILSNLALCFYKQGNYEKSIEYDLKMIEIDPKFGKSIVRLFNAYSRTNKIQQAANYGDLFLELEQETSDKFKGTQAKVQDEKKKLKTLLEEERAKFTKEFAKYGIPIIVLLLAVLIFLLVRKK